MDDIDYDQSKLREQMYKVFTLDPPEEDMEEALALKIGLLVAVGNYGSEVIEDLESVRDKFREENNLEKSTGVTELIKEFKKEFEVE